MADNNEKGKTSSPTLLKKKHLISEAVPPKSNKKVARKVVRKVVVKKAGPASAKAVAPASAQPPRSQRGPQPVSSKPAQTSSPGKLPAKPEALKPKPRVYKSSVQFELPPPPRKRALNRPGGPPAGRKRLPHTVGQEGVGNQNERGQRPYQPRNKSAPGTGVRDKTAPVGGLGNKSAGPGSPSPAGGKPPGAGDGLNRPASRHSQPRRQKDRERDERRKEELKNFASQMKRKRSSGNVHAVPKEISILESLTVSELARKMNLKASDIIGKLMGLGVMVSINQTIDTETAIAVANQYNCKVNIVSLYDETIIESELVDEDKYIPRAPVVAVMGHVDHGKTSLLDAIRKSDTADQEHGAITQHIGAYQVHMPEGHSITFIDTPGHEAFSLMRSRGAQITDVIILVVASDDGVMPQTIEAIHHAKEAKVPIIVAITKIDLPQANPERVKQQLAEHDLAPSEWGGSTSYVGVSAKTGENLSSLLETIVLETEIMELKAPVTGRAEGKVIESRIDPGRGIVATVLIQRGTLRIGEAYVAGIHSGRVRAMFNEKGERLEETGPSMPVEIIGLSDTPEAGDPFQATENEKMAKLYSQKRRELKKQKASSTGAKLTLDTLYDHIREKSVQELKVIIKSDVSGSAEALHQALEKLSTDEIRLACIHASAGAITESDVNLATASNAIIIGFHVRPTAKAQMIADQEKVDIRKYSIIYDVIQDIHTAMEGMLSPETQEHIQGEAEIRAIFKNSQIGTIAGCMVLKGTLTRKSKIRIFRDDIEIHYGNLSSLKRFKEDVREVREGFECGLTIENFHDLKEGDRLEIIEERKVTKKLTPQNSRSED